MKEYVRVKKGEIGINNNDWLFICGEDLVVEEENVKSVYRPAKPIFTNILTGEKGLPNPDYIHAYTYKNWLDEEIKSGRLLLIYQSWVRKEKATCEGKIVEIEGKKYQLTEVKS